jgi:ABC-2 type transport system permease protein
VSGTVANQIASLAARSVVRQLRQPAHVIPPLLFPMALLLVNAAGLHRSVDLPGFPTDSFLPFALAVPFIQGALFATLNGGSDLARDIQTGFLNRLALTPMRGSALIAGHLAGVVVLGLMQACVYLAIGLAFGAGLASGFFGAFVLLFLSALIALGFGGLGTFVALRTGSGEATQATFPVFFVFLFISSMNTPRNLINVDWFRYAATVNPVSYLIEGVRSLIITGWNGEALALAFGVSTVLAVISVGLSAWALQLRLTRT